MHETIRILKQFSNNIMSLTSVGSLNLMASINAPGSRVRISVTESVIALAFEQSAYCVPPYAPSNDVISTIN